MLRKNNKESDTVKHEKDIKSKAMYRKRLALKNDMSAWVLLLPAAICIYLFILRPQMQGVYWSFFNMRGFTPTDFVGIDNYKRVLTDTAFLKAFGNTWKYIIYSLVIGFPIPFIIAIVMNEMLHFRKLTRTIVYLPAVMPAVAVSLLWYFVYFPDASGLANMVLGKLGIAPYEWLQDSRYTIMYIIISMTWAGMGGTAIYYFATLQGINRELYEAAIIDGAGFFRRLWVVTIPHMSGMLALFAVRQIISVFNVMEQPLQMTDGGPNNASISLGLLNYRYAFVQQRPQFALALGLIMFFVMSIFTVIYFYIDKKIENSRG